MTIPSGAATIAAALPLIAIVALLARRWVRRRRAVVDDDPEYTLVFPDGPDDTPGRGTRVGRALKPRR